MSHPTSRRHTAPAMLPAVPVALLLDKRLMPLERNAWMILYASADPGGHVTNISYTQLRQFLACVPENELASRETVARTLTVLRLTRWIHIEAHTRNPLTGYLSTNHYVVHTQPVSITQVCHRDQTWITLLEQAFLHASLAVRQVARHVLVELATDPDALAQMPASIRERVWQLPLPPSNDDDDPPPSSGQQGLPVGDRTRSDARPASKPPNGTVQSSSFCSKHTYVPRPRESAPGTGTGIDGLRLPAGFAALSADQQRDVLRGLRRLDQRQRQPVLEEWSARCLLGQVLRPVAYLFGLIRKALAGEFRLWAAIRHAPAAPATLPPVPAPAPLPRPATVSSVPRPAKPSASPEVVRKHLEQIAAMLGVPSPAPLIQGLARGAAAMRSSGLNGAGASICQQPSLDSSTNCM